jgi:hypothetical protein
MNWIDDLSLRELADISSMMDESDGDWSARQIKALKLHFPGWEVKINAEWLLVLKGTLKPFSKGYSVRVVAHRSRIKNKARCMIRQPLGPIVTVDGITNIGLADPPPHIYRFTTQTCSDHFHLCLFDHRPFGLVGEDRQWSDRELIAETTLPWASEWLASYEIWKATGKWKSGGSHPDRSVGGPNGMMQDPARRMRSGPSASRLISNLTGTSASYRLMVAASEEPSLL